MLISTLVRITIVALSLSCVHGRLILEQFMVSHAARFVHALPLYTRAKVKAGKQRCLQRLADERVREFVGAAGTRHIASKDTCLMWHPKYLPALRTSIREQSFVTSKVLVSHLWIGFTQCDYFCCLSENVRCPCCVCVIAMRHLATSSVC